MRIFKLFFMMDPARIKKFHLSLYFLIISQNAAQN
jgi:hypothetical protein